jgi:hypothetical protein
MVFDPAMFDRATWQASSLFWASGLAIASFVVIAISETRSPPETHSLHSWYRWSMLIQFAGFVLLAVSARYFDQPLIADALFDVAVALIGIALFVALIGGLVGMRKQKRA